MSKAQGKFYFSVHHPFKLGHQVRASNHIGKAIPEFWS